MLERGVNMANFKPIIMSLREDDGTNLADYIDKLTEKAERLETILFRARCHADSLDKKLGREKAEVEDEATDEKCLYVCDPKKNTQCPKTEVRT
jgi:dsDNA-binding SOS-regulon protein